MYHLHRGVVLDVDTCTAVPVVAIIVHTAAQMRDTASKATVCSFETYPQKYDWTASDKLLKYVLLEELWYVR